MDASAPIARDLVLLGGGHSHVIVLRMLGMKPVAGLEVTLVSDVSHAPYSGMLPGYLAGFYDYDEVHIDLRKLCQFAGARFILAAATGIDLTAQKVCCQGRSAIAYDVLSINIGSNPAVSSIPGVGTHAYPSKPVPRFLTAWHEVQTELEDEQQPLSITVVGGGAGGVEIALAAKKRFSEITNDKVVNVHLVEGSPEILSGHGRKFRQLINRILQQQEITVQVNAKVHKVDATKVYLESGEEITSDCVFWVTHAAPPQWFDQAGFALSEGGFIKVHSSLQSVSHPEVFAAGDIADVLGHSRPKSGVFAVRQGRPLYENLCRYLEGKSPREFKPQQKFLSILGAGDGTAVAGKGAWAYHSCAVWRWKQWIDRKFMRRFADLPQMDQKPDELTAQTDQNPDGLPQALLKLQQRGHMRCSGCAAKVGSDVLSRALSRVYQEADSDGDASVPAPEDAAVITVPDGMNLVQTIDYFPALVTDPHTFGRIVVNHCFSDVFAMGAEAASAQALVLVPFAAEQKMEENIYQLLSGVVAGLNQCGAVLLGGHTAESEQLALGLVCNGYISKTEQSPWHKSGMQPGDVLIHTKAIGTGTLFAADMRLETKGRWLDAAIDSMLLSNQQAMAVLRRFPVHSCTDVTGFGLMGHLLEMVQASGVKAQVSLDDLVALPGAEEMSRRGFVSSLFAANVRSAAYIENHQDFTGHPSYPLIFDPQTSGGLLVSVPAAVSEVCLAELHHAGYLDAHVIGSVAAGASEETPIRLG